MTQPVTCRTCEQQLGSAALIRQLRSQRDEFTEVWEDNKARMKETDDALFVMENERNALRTRLQQVEGERDAAWAEMEVAKEWSAMYGECDGQLEAARVQLAALQRERSGLLEIKAQWDEAVEAGLIIAD